MIETKRRVASPRDVCFWHAALIISAGLLLAAAAAIWRGASNRASP
jgi:hypothetical protein